MENTNIKISLELDKVCNSIYNEIPYCSELLKLNDVLKWHSSNGRDKYSHFEVSKGDAYFSLYDGEDKDDIFWDLSTCYLHKQSNDLIEWLAELV